MDDQDPTLSQNQRSLRYLLLRLRNELAEMNANNNTSVNNTMAIDGNDRDNSSDDYLISDRISFNPRTNRHSHNHYSTNTNHVRVRIDDHILNVLDDDNSANEASYNHDNINGVTHNNNSIESSQSINNNDDDNLNGNEEVDEEQASNNQHSHSDNDNDNDNFSFTNSPPHFHVHQYKETNLQSYYANETEISKGRFFKNHAEHEFFYDIPISMQKYGLVNLMKNLLIYRNDQLDNLDSYYEGPKRKRTYNDICIGDMDLCSSFSFNNQYTELPFQQLTPLSFLKTGSVFSIPVSLNKNIPTLKFTNVDFSNLNVSGFFQLSDIQLGFKGKIIDFLREDFRSSKDKKFLIEGNIFNNLLRNKLFLSNTFEKYFDKTKKKCYTKTNWKPFSMDSLGYIKNNNQSQKFTSINKKYKVNPVKPTKFPNSSIFHKLQSTNNTKFDNFKFLSKWFDLSPLNQFNNTPSPPTPPHRPMKYTNNPENLLVCKDCVNLMMSKYVFLKLEIDIHDFLLKNKSSNSIIKTNNDLKVYPDLVYKHRRRYKEYAMRSGRSSRYINADDDFAEESNNTGRNTSTNMSGDNNRNINRRRTFSDRVIGNSIVFDNAMNVTSFRSLNNTINSDNDNHSSEFEDVDFFRRNYNEIFSENIDNHETDDSDTNADDVGFGTDYDFHEPFLRDRLQDDDVPNDEPRGTSIVSESDNDDCNSNEEEEENGNTDNSNVNERSNRNRNRNRNGSELQRSYNPSRYNIIPNMESVWPVSAERHPILDPEITSNEGDNSDEDYNSPYTIFSNNRSRRITRLLFSIDINREQHRHRKDSVSGLKLYGNSSINSSDNRMKLTLLCCVNRKTGELSIVPGNLDVNMWSAEQNNGEFFEDIETFSSVFNLFTNNKNIFNSDDDNLHTKKINKWIKKREGEIKDIKKLLFLQMFANPSILNKLINNEQERKKLIERRNIKKNEKNEKMKRKQLKKPKYNKEVNDETKNENENEKTKENKLHELLKKEVGIYNDEIIEQMMTALKEDNQYVGGSDRVLSFIPGERTVEGLNKSTDGYGNESIHNSRHSFEYA